MQTATYDLRVVHASADRRAPWAKIEEEGLARVVMFHKLNPCLLDWLEAVNPASAVQINAYDQGALCGVAWVNPICGLSGCAHGCIFRRWRHDADNLGRQAIQMLFEDFNFASLWAFLPARYRHMTAQAERWGFLFYERHIQQAMPMPQTGKSGRCVDGLFGLLPRDDFIKGNGNGWSY